MWGGGGGKAGTAHVVSTEGELRPMPEGGATHASWRTGWGGAGKPRPHVWKVALLMLAGALDNMGKGPGGKYTTW